MRPDELAPALPHRPETFLGRAVASRSAPGPELPPERWVGGRFGAGDERPSQIGPSAEKEVPRMADTSLAQHDRWGAHDEVEPARGSREPTGPEQNETMLLVPARGVHPRARGTMPVLRMRVSILHPGVPA
jgi:hypothetical protein